jgi:hypothetical protein
MSSPIKSKATCDRAPAGGVRVAALYLSVQEYLAARGALLAEGNLEYMCSTAIKSPWLHPGKVVDMP